METTRTSYIEHQLSQVEASSPSRDAFMSFLASLKEVILDLIDHPFDGRYNIINHTNEEFASELFSTQQAREFLKFLGYNEEGDRFVYNISDENMSKLEDCLQILQNQVNKQQGVVLCEVNGDNIQRKAHKQDGKQTKEEVQCKSKAMRCGSGLKEFFLSKHMKKEHCDSPALRKKNHVRSPDFAFNTSGYFHQSCSNKDNSRDNRNTKQSKRCFIRDLFHKQDHHIKGWSSPGCDVKLI